MPVALSNITESVANVVVATADAIHNDQVMFRCCIASARVAHALAWTAVTTLTCRLLLHCYGRG